MDLAKSVEAGTFACVGLEPPLKGGGDVRCRVAADSGEPSTAATAVAQPGRRRAREAPEAPEAA
jgi:hypothetical protein